MTESTDQQPTIEWGVLGPSGRVWTPDPVDSAGREVDVEVIARDFSLGSNMPLMRRVDGGDWVEAK